MAGLLELINKGYIVDGPEGWAATQDAPPEAIEYVRGHNERLAKMRKKQEEIYNDYIFKMENGHLTRRKR